MLLAACPGSSPSPGSSTGPRSPLPGRASDKPKLVVLLVLDQWPEWAFEQKRPHLTKGFRRLLSEGDWHVGQYPSGANLTAPGHALLGTGEPPASSGILANEWFHRTLNKTLHSVEDETGAVTSKWLRVPALGDAVKAANTGGKAVAVSLKDRASVLPLGHAGTGIWYDRASLSWVANAPTTWLTAHNAAHPIAKHLDDVWTPLDAGRLATLSGTTDAQPGEVGDMGHGPTFPHALAKTRSPAEALYATPIGAHLVFETALAAMEGEALGKDASADLLVVSISPHDYIGHGWGHESWEMWDLTLRLDDEIDRFLDQLDKRVGVGEWALLATSDHGASPLPERMPNGGRISYAQIKDAANRAASAELGPGEWIAHARYPTVYVTDALLAQPAKERDKALKKIVFALRSFPGIARVERTADFAGHCETRTGDAFLLCLTLDPERSGEVLWMPAPGWITMSETNATAHGSLNAYDRLVPVIMLPPGRTAHAPHTKASDTTIQMIRVATVLAGWLGVPSPTTLQKTWTPPSP